MSQRDRETERDRGDRDRDRDRESYEILKTLSLSLFPFLSQEKYNF